MIMDMHTFLFPFPFPSSLVLCPPLPILSLFFIVPDGYTSLGLKAVL